MTLVDAGTDQEQTYDPSKVLSPYTGERLTTMVNSDLVQLEQGFRVLEVNVVDEGYELVSTTGDTLFSKANLLTARALILIWDRPQNT